MSEPGRIGNLWLRGHDCATSQGTNHRPPLHTPYARSSNRQTIVALRGQQVSCHELNDSSFWAK